MLYLTVSDELSRVTVMKAWTVTALQRSGLLNTPHIIRVPVVDWSDQSIRMW